MRKGFTTDLSHHFVRQVASDLLRSTVPEPHPLLPVQHINANRQVLQHQSVNCRIFKKPRHDWPYRLSARKAKTSEARRKQDFTA